MFWNPSFTMRGYTSKSRFLGMSTMYFSMSLKSVYAILCTSIPHYTSAYTRVCAYRTFVYTYTMFDMYTATILREYRRKYIISSLAIEVHYIIYSFKSNIKILLTSSSFIRAVSYIYIPQPYATNNK